MTDLGQKLTNGTPAYGCPHMAAWLRAWTAYGIARGWIKESWDVVQALGYGSLSGGTHGPPGTCLDLLIPAGVSGGEIAEAAREAGTFAWARGARWGQPSMGEHIHLGLFCPCASPADYQGVAMRKGRDGLGDGGMAGPDYHTRPAAPRDFWAGIDWMHAQTRKLTPQSAIGGDDMPNLSEMQVPNPYGARKGNRRADRVVAEAARYAAMSLNATNRLAAAFAAFVAAEKGADSAISRQVASAAEAIRADVAAVDADVDAISDHLGAKEA